jgi:hypothetical protein
MAVGVNRAIFGADRILATDKITLFLFVSDGFAPWTDHACMGGLWVSIGRAPQGDHEASIFARPDVAASRDADVHQNSTGATVGRDFPPRTALNEAGHEALRAIGALIKPPRRNESHEDSFQFS